MMSRRSILATGAAMLLITAPTLLAKQSGVSVVRLKYEVTLTRTAPGKPAVSSPFSLTSTGVDNGKSGLIFPRASLRVGMDVPSSIMNDGKAQTSMRTVGTQVDCKPAAVADGVYSSEILVSDTAVFRDDFNEEVERAKARLAQAEREVARAKAVKDETSDRYNLLVNNALTGQEMASVALRAAENNATRADRVDLSAIRTLTLQNVLVMRDGETQEIATATDRTTGETIKATVKLTVLK
jgi:hypothetical protein